MIVFENEILKLNELSFEEFKCSIEKQNLIDEKYGLNDSENQNDSIFIEVMNQLINECDEGKKNYMLYKMFQIILKDENRVVGSISLKNYYKNEKGFYEIGYGLNEKYRNKGIMRGALKNFIEYFFCNDYAEGFYAEVLKENPPSSKVLIANNFEKVDEYEDLYVYKIIK